MEIGARRGLGEVSPIRNLDPTLLLAALGLTVYGLLMVYSATQQSLSTLNEDPGFFLKRQAVFLVLGLGAMILATAFDYRLLKPYAPLIYLGVVVLLLAVLSPLGSGAAGAQRWITLPGFQLQPAEVAKLGLVVMLAAYFSEVRGEIGLEHVWRAAGLTVIPLVLVFVQPDVGTSMVFAVILVGMLVVAGAKAKHIGILALVALIAVVGAFRVGVVQDYQVARLTGFLDPANDPLRAGYNRAQAEIAIGSGGLTGAGYLQGSQTNLDFVPEQHTDFIFTVVGEELGFVGAMLLLFLYALVLWRGLRIARGAKDSFGTQLATGIVAVLGFQMFVNIGMTVGIMPITGIPLPLVSYGGSALITNLVGVGLLLNIHMRRVG